MFFQASRLKVLGLVLFSGFAFASQAVATAPQPLPAAQYAPPQLQPKQPLGASMVGNTDTVAIRIANTAYHKQKLRHAPFAKPQIQQPPPKADRQPTASEQPETNGHKSENNSEKLGVRTIMANADAAVIKSAPSQPATLETAPPSSAKLQKTAATTEKAAPPASEATGMEASPKPLKVEPTLVVTINLSKQRMYVSINGKPTYTWRISSGIGRYRTPNGSFKPTWMSRMHYSRQWNGAPMPYSVFFHKGYAVHGTYAIRALGRPASHGCVRLSPANAKTFFNLVRKHGKLATQINVVGKTPYYASRSRRAARVASWRKRVTSRRRAYSQRRARKKAFWPFDL